MITEEDIAARRAIPVAPLYQPILWAKAESFPLSALIVVLGFFFIEIDWWPIKILIVGIGCAGWVVLQRFGELDDRFFSIPNGFTDRVEYIATGTVTEYDRDLG